MWIRTRGENVVISCRVHPNASRDALEGIKDDFLNVRLCCPPVEGRANKALVKLLSKRLKLPKSRISILHGEKSRTKVLSLEGCDEEYVLDVLGLNP